MPLPEPKDNSETAGIQGSKVTRFTRTSDARGWGNHLYYAPAPAIYPGAKLQTHTLESEHYIFIGTDQHALSGVNYAVHMLSCQSKTQSDVMQVKLLDRKAADAEVSKEDLVAHLVSVLGPVARS